jgi:hypothetical protein
MACVRRPALASASSKVARFRNAVGALLSDARVIFVSELLSESGHPSALPTPTSPPSFGAVIHCWSRFLLTRGPHFLTSSCSWSSDQCDYLLACLLHLVSNSPWTLPIDSAPLLATVWPPHKGPTKSYPAIFCVSLLAIRSGSPWQETLEIFSNFPDGHLSEDGHVFATPQLFSRPFTPLRRLPIFPASDLDGLDLFFSGRSLVAIASSASLLPHLASSPLRPLVASPHRPPFPSRFLPSYIRLKLNKAGRPIVPSRHVTSVVEASAEWHARVSPLDAVTAAIVEGRLVMPKSRFPLRPSRRPNHTSWQ